MSLFKQVCSVSESCSFAARNILLPLGLAAAASKSYCLYRNTKKYFLIKEIIQKMQKMSI